MSGMKNLDSCLAGDDFCGVNFGFMNMLGAPLADFWGVNWGSMNSRGRSSSSMHCKDVSREVCDLESSYLNQGEKSLVLFSRAYFC